MMKYWLLLSVGACTSSMVVRARAASLVSQQDSSSQEKTAAL